jgi:hypothetical protein
MPYVSSASYQAAPELASLQERLFGTFGQGLTAAETMQQQAGALGDQATQLYGLGAGYLAESPEAARQRFISQQQALVGGQNEQALSGIRNRLFQTGRTGLATGGTTTGMQATNPELAAYYNAMAQQNLQIAAGADQAAQQQQTFGAGLLGTGTQLQQAQQQTLAGAYSPLQTLLGLSGNVENLSQMPYQLGIQLGSAAQPGQTAGANLYQQGMSQAANTAYQGTAAANAANAAFWSGIISGGAQIMAPKPPTSDLRTKENIKFEGILPSGLNLYSYEYKEEFKDKPTAGYGRYTGVMAQEVLEIIPEAVSVDSDGYYMVDYSLIH